VPLCRIIERRCRLFTRVEPGGRQGTATGATPWPAGFLLKTALGVRPEKFTPLIAPAGRRQLRRGQSREVLSKGTDPRVPHPGRHAIVPGEKGLPMTPPRWFGFALLLTIVPGGMLGCALPAAAPPTPGQFRHVGAIVHDDTQDGYRFSFQLMSTEEKRATLPRTAEPIEGARGVNHHLMLIVLSPEGRFVTNASVHFFVRGPDGTMLELQAVPMAGGYGADLDMQAKGTYELRAEVSVDGRVLVDVFTHERT